MYHITTTSGKRRPVTAAKIAQLYADKKLRLKSVIRTEAGKKITVEEVLRLAEFDIQAPLQAQPQPVPQQAQQQDASTAAFTAQAAVKPAEALPSSPPWLRLLFSKNGAPIWIAIIIVGLLCLAYSEREKTHRSGGRYAAQKAVFMFVARTLGLGGTVIISGITLGAGGALFYYRNRNKVRWPN